MEKMFHPVSYRPLEIVDEGGNPTMDADLCADCPRRLGTKLVKAAGIKGILGVKNTVSAHDAPLVSGKITGYVTNGLHGILMGENGTNSGTVSYLNGESIDGVIKDIARCDGPNKFGDCDALGPRDFDAVVHLAEDMDAAPVIERGLREIALPPALTE